MKLFVDAARNLLILLGKNHKLIGLVETIDNRIGYQHAHEKHYKTIDQLLQIHQDEEGGPHNDEIAHHVHFAIRDVPVFAYHEGDDV